MIKINNPTSQFHHLNPIWTKPQIWVVSSPRKSSFSQITKLVKLNTINHVYNISQQKPIDQLWKKRLNSSRSPNISRSENIPYMHEKKCMKNENKLKKKGIKILPALGEKNLAKRMEENDKKLDWSLDRVVWGEKKLKTFWKNEFEHVKISF